MARKQGEKRYMHIFNTVIDIINNVFLVLCGIAFAVQIIYCLLYTSDAADEL